MTRYHLAERTRTCTTPNPHPLRDSCLIPAPRSIGLPSLCPMSEVARNGMSCDFLGLCPRFIHADFGPLELQSRLAKTSAFRLRCSRRWPEQQGAVFCWLSGGVAGRSNHRNRQNASVLVEPCQAAQPVNLHDYVPVAPASQCGASTSEPCSSPDLSSGAAMQPFGQLTNMAARQHLRKAIRIRRPSDFRIWFSTFNV
jgi:hypothetical protein